MKHLIAALFIVMPSLTQAVTRFTPEEAAHLQDALIVTADAFIQPGYTALADAASEMTDALAGYCREEGPITAVTDGFESTFLAWQRISVIGFGPVEQEEGAMRVQLWPDPKGFARRATRAAIRAEDPALLEPGALRGRSVALINLTALEELLYTDLTPRTYGCDLATALARHQADLAASFAADWTASEFRSAFETAAQGNALYPDVDSLIRDLLAGAVVYTDRMRKFKLERGLGAEAGQARPKRTEARKSGLGLKSIAVSYQALQDLYEVPFGFFDLTPDLGGSMDFFMLGQAAGNISASLSFEPRTLEQIAVADGPRADELRAFAQLLLFHEEYLKVGLPASIGMTSGFTSADGD